MTRKTKQSTEAAVRQIRRRTRRKFAPEEKIRIVLEGRRGERDGPVRSWLAFGAIRMLIAHGRKETGCASA